LATDAGIALEKEAIGAYTSLDFSLEAGEGLFTRYGNLEVRR
jgi:hypothetical protein